MATLAAGTSVIDGETAFLRYLTLFNEPDYEGFTAFYTDDVVFELPGVRLVGPSEVVAVYRDHHAHLRESTTLEWLVIGPGSNSAGRSEAGLGKTGLVEAGSIAAEMTVRFDVFADWPEFPLGPVVAGDVRVTRSWVHYDLVAGKVSHVRVNPLGPPPPAASGTRQGA